MDIAKFKKLPILGIIRTSGPIPVEELIAAVISSGLRTIEIAMNSYSAEAVIKQAVKAAKGTLTIGAGTVLDLDTLKTALDSGATFIVMPARINTVVEYCVKNEIPVFPGALTPKEVFDAWRLGAAMVKIFPAGVFGPAYFKELKAPYNNIDLLACGGVTVDNIKEYFASGARAVAFGASIFSRDLIDKRDFITIERSIRSLILKSGFHSAES